MVGILEGEMKTIKEIIRNDDGSIDMIDSDGVRYVKCYMTSYTEPNSDVIEKEVVTSFKLSTGSAGEYNIKIDGNFYQACGFKFPEGYAFPKINLNVNAIEELKQKYDTTHPIVRTIESKKDHKVYIHCSRCGEQKLQDEYWIRNINYPDARGMDNRLYYCKECMDKLFEQTEREK